MVPKTLVLLIVFTCWSNTNGLKILGMLAGPSYSHFAIGNAILEALYDVGHEITLVSPFPRKVPVKNFRDLNTTDLYYKLRDDVKINGFDLRGFGKFGQLLFLPIMGAGATDDYLSHKEVQKLMKSGEMFDICLFEVFQMDALMGLSETFNCSIITFAVFSMTNWVDDTTGNISPPSYVPHNFMDYTGRMSFALRIFNTIVFNVERLSYSIINLPRQRKLYKKYFPNARKTLDEIIAKPSIVFMNSHFSTSAPRPYLPNMIEVGGIQIKPVKPLPKDIQEFLDSATDGAIVFSMGSVIKDSEWPEEKRKILLKVFGKIKRKILWKYENDTLPNKPDNIMISQWLPQRDVLAHPNVKLFMGHGGYLGSTEAFYEGIPILGIPIFGDQMSNMAQYVEQGAALQIIFENMTEETISSALNEMLTNPKYKKTAELFAARIKDRPITPQQAVVYWTEFTARHKDSPYINSIASEMSFIQLHLIDVYLVIILGFFGIVWIFFIVLKFLLFRKKITKTNSNKKTQ